MSKTLGIVLAGVAVLYLVTKLEGPGSSALASASPSAPMGQLTVTRFAKQHEYDSTCEVIGTVRNSGGTSLYQPIIIAQAMRKGSLAGQEEALADIRQLSAGQSSTFSVPGLPCRSDAISITARLPGSGGEIPVIMAAH